MEGFVVVFTAGEIIFEFDLRLVPLQNSVILSNWVGDIYVEHI